MFAGLTLANGHTPTQLLTHSLPPPWDRGRKQGEKARGSRSGALAPGAPPPSSCSPLGTPRAASLTFPLTPCCWAVFCPFVHSFSPERPALAAGLSHGPVGADWSPVASSPPSAPRQRLGHRTRCIREEPSIFYSYLPRQDMTVFCNSFSTVYRHLCK